MPPSPAAQFPYLRLQLLVAPEPEEEQPAAALHAPLLRRVLGRALLDAFCPFGEPLCQPRPAKGGPPPRPQDLCRLAECCPYGVLYAASRSRRPPFGLFVPAPSGSSAGHLLEITLLGAAWPLYPWALAALRRALADGLGKARVRWRLREISRSGAGDGAERLCGDDLSRLSPALEPDQLNLASPWQPDAPERAVEVRFLSPTRLIQDGRLLPGTQSVPFELLIARILDRLQAVFPEASPLVTADERERLQAAAAGVPSLGDETPWVEVQDYSARSRAELLLGGKVGRALYGAGAMAFLPLLRAGEILQVGKNVASGCGRIEVRPVAAGS